MYFIIVLKLKKCKKQNHSFKKNQGKKTDELADDKHWPLSCSKKSIMSIQSLGVVVSLDSSWCSVVAFNMQVAVLPQFKILFDISSFLSKVTANKVKQVITTVNNENTWKVINLGRLMVAKTSGGSLPGLSLKMFLKGAVSSAIVVVVVL